MIQLLRSRRFQLAAAALLVILFGFSMLFKSGGDDAGEDGRIAVKPGRGSSVESGGKRTERRKPAGSYDVPIPGTGNSKRFPVDGGVEDPFVRNEEKGSRPARDDSVLPERMSERNTEKREALPDQTTTTTERGTDRPSAQISPRPGVAPGEPSGHGSAAPAPAPVTAGKTAQTAATTASGKISTAREPVPPPLPPPYPYRLSGILDRSGVLCAVLSDNRTNYTVRRGDRLPDGSQVTEVSRGYVTLRRGNQTRIIRM